MACRQFDGFAGANQQHAGLIQPREIFLCQAYCDRRHRHRVGTDAGIGTGALGGGKGLLKQPVQLPAQRARLTRGGPCLFHLAQDLRLAQYQRIQTTGYPEQVTHRIGIAVPVQIRMHIVAGIRMRRQPVGQDLPVTVGMGIQLGAVAGG